MQSLSTGVTLGYQMALDPVNRKVYATDAQWRNETKVPVLGDDGDPVAPPQWIRQVTASATGKLVEFDIAKRLRGPNISFTGLKRWDSTTADNQPLEWFAGASASSQRTTFSPYGLAVDGTLNPPVAITTTARARKPSLGWGGSAVAFPLVRQVNGNITAPTDAHRIFEFSGADAGTPILDGPRRVAVDTQRHIAYLTNLGGPHNGASPNPGFILAVDLTKVGDGNATDGNPGAAIARIPIPTEPGLTALGAGGLGVAVDEANNLIYVGTYRGKKLYVIDGDQIDTSDATDFSINSGAISALPADVGPNSRPTYNAALKRVYVSSYDDKTISVVNADPASPSYGQKLTTINTGNTNAVEVDAQRGLLYSAELQNQEIRVYSTSDHSLKLSVPTSGDALNLDIDPVTRDVWVSNFSNAAKLDVLSVLKPGEGPALPTGPQGPAGKDGKDGKPGKVGASNVVVALSSLKAVGSRVTVRAPGAGKFTATLKRKGKVLARGAKTVRKAGKTTIVLKRTKAGKKALKKKRAVKGNLTVKFAPKATSSAAVSRTVKASLKR